MWACLKNFVLNEIPRRVDNPVVDSAVIEARRRRRLSRSHSEVLLRSPRSTTCHDVVHQFGRGNDCELIDAVYSPRVVRRLEPI
jgi:hypothetical protein